MAAKKPPRIPAEIVNRRAKYEYEILQEIEAGIVLMGSELKSIRTGKVNLQDAFAVQKLEEIWLHNLHISEYGLAKHFSHEPKRQRKLLLHKKEIRKLIGLLQTQGITLIPLKLYFNEKGRVKLLLAVGKGKKAHDKRESEKQKDWVRERGRILKGDFS
jgi:SsrA-binding protein